MGATEEDAIPEDNSRVLEENDEGLMMIHEDNIVSEEEDFTEEDIESEEEVQTDEIKNVPAVVAELDDIPILDTSNSTSRPRRANTGAGVERLQMDFSGKGYGARREFNFVTNEKKEKLSQSDLLQHSFMQVAYDVILSQTVASVGPKKHM